MSLTAPSLMVLIPAYNEENRIGPVLADYAEYFIHHYPGRFQLVVVLNGCRDNTLGVVREVARKYACLSILDFPDPIGKGGALIEGLKLAPLADFIGYVDADGATSPKAFHEIVKLRDQADCIIGSRWLPGSVLHQNQTRLRRFTSRCFHAIVQAFFWMNIQDTQCPAKIMRRDVVEAIHETLTVADLAFDVNLLVSIKRHGFTILEVPTEWTDIAGSKVTASLFRSSLVMFLSVLRVRLIYWPWIYRFLRPLRPIEAFVYRRLRAPLPLRTPGKSSPGFSTARFKKQ